MASGWLPIIGGEGQTRSTVLCVTKCIKGVGGGGRGFLLSWPCGQSTECSSPRPQQHPLHPQPPHGGGGGRPPRSHAAGPARSHRGAWVECLPSAPPQKLLRHILCMSRFYKSDLALRRGQTSECDAPKCSGLCAEMPFLTLLAQTASIEGSVPPCGEPPAAAVQREPARSPCPARRRTRSLARSAQAPGSASPGGRAPRRARWRRCGSSGSCHERGAAPSALSRERGPGEGAGGASRLPLSPPPPLRLGRSRPRPAHRPARGPHCHSIRPMGSQRHARPRVLSSLCALPGRFLLRVSSGDVKPRVTEGPAQRECPRLSVSLTCPGLRGDRRACMEGTGAPAAGLT